jgi:hypothetical protein
MKWIISFVIGWYMCCINIEGDGMECIRQRYICRAFHFTSQGCVEKCMTEFRIDGLSTKNGRQSTEGYTHDGRLIGRGARDQELDGNETQDTRFIQVQAVTMT